jgi:hypothetical protein
VKRAKQINYWPDICNEETWRTYQIALARVVRVFSQFNRTQVQISIQEQFSGGPVNETRTAPLAHYWFGMDLSRPIELRADDWIVVYYLRKGQSYIVTQKLDLPPGDSALVEGLAGIARLRSTADGAATYFSSALGGNQIVSLYALRRLVSLPELQPPPGVAPELRAARDDQTRAPEIRLLSSQLANRIERSAEDSDEELAWVESAFSRSSEAEWAALRPFTDRLIGFDRRADVAHFLAELVTDSGQRRPVRIAAYASFQDPRLFSFDHPDPPSEELFAASARVLNDPDPQLRMAGASLLSSLSRRVAEPFKQEYTARARNAVEQRAQVETDQPTSHQLKTSLALFDRPG